ncbi:MAG: GNAT family N-acetyltransferase [Luteolibacter sp.]
MAAITIRPLRSADLAAAAVLLATLNSDTPEALVAERLQTLLADHAHYQIIGAFSDTILIGVAGAWVATKIWCGRYLEIDNLVVDPIHRSSGVGNRLIRHLEDVARERDCKIIVLDSYTANRPSHRLYHRLGFEIWGFHFVKAIGDWKGDGCE